MNGDSFYKLESTYAARCSGYGWECPFPASSNGRAFCKAAKLFFIVVLLNGADKLLKDRFEIENIRDSSGKMRCGLELALKRIVALLPLRTDHWGHRSPVIGCAGVFVVGQLPPFCIVMDGVEV